MHEVVEGVLLDTAIGRSVGGLLDGVDLGFGEVVEASGGLVDCDAELVVVGEHAGGEGG